MLVEGLEHCTASDQEHLSAVEEVPVPVAGPALALDVAQSWVASAHAAFLKTGFMFEKYNSDEFGVGGGGGEYEPQVRKSLFQWV